MKIQTRNISKLSLFIALSATLTIFPRFPNGIGGFLHFGNVVFYVAAILEGPIFSGIVGGVGQAFADLILGRGFYVLPTLLIKFLAGFVFGSVLNGTKFRLILGFFASFLVITIGYFVWKWILFRNFAFVFFTLLCNLISLIVGMITVFFLMPFLDNYNNRYRE